jgi:hypothetical protein
MRNKKRIPIVLDKIDWNLFISDNLELNISQTNLLVNKIKDNIEGITNYWNNNPDLRLGQLLIKQGYTPETLKLWNCEETDWLVNNNLCAFEDINFWGRTRDINNNKLPQIQYIVLKELDDAHISAILDWCDEHNIKIKPKYEEYFNKRIEKLKIKN